MGYGDISPQTGIGQALAALIMIIGYSIIAVPTGIITVEISRAAKMKDTHNICSSCGAGDHDNDADYCKYRGNKL